LVGASLLNNNALSFGDTSSTTFKLVVASIKNKDLKAQQMTSLQSSVLTQRTILHLKVLCGSSLQQLQHLFGMGPLTTLCPAVRL
jgi:hypothetical protein